MTQSPGESPFTADPKECTSPTPSYPPTAGSGGLTGYTPTPQILPVRIENYFKRRIIKPVLLKS